MKFIFRLLAGALPGVLTFYLAWFPLREWLFSMIPPGAEWAFWAQLATVIGIFLTVGGGLPVGLLVIGIGLAVGIYKF